MSSQKTLSCMENTPEFQKARILSQNDGRGEWTFYTTLGHIVTKILDMNMRFTLPDNTELPLFQTVGEVNTFFLITPQDYSRIPNRPMMDHFVSEIYRKRVAPKEKEILSPQREMMKVFFEINIWRMVRDNDKIDTLLAEIDKLASMGIQKVDSYVCDDLKEWIIKNCIGKGKTLDDWYKLAQDSGNKYRVKDIEKEMFTEYFSDLVVDLPWRRNPNNTYRQMYGIQKRIRSLYVVDSDLKDIVGKGGNSPMRNTRYL